MGLVRVGQAGLKLPQSCCLSPPPALLFRLTRRGNRAEQGPGVHFLRLCPVRLSDLKLWLVQSKAPSP